MSAPASPPAADLSHSSGGIGGLKGNHAVEERKGDALERGKKFIPLCEVYSVTSPCVTATGSKKVTAAARKPQKSSGNDQLGLRPILVKPWLTQVYSRRWKKVNGSSFHGSILQDLTVKSEQLESEEGEWESGIKRRRVEGSAKLVKSVFFYKSPCKLDDQMQAGNGSGKTSIQNVKKRRNFKIGINDETSRKSDNQHLETENGLNNSGAGRMKWVRLSFAETDPKKFVGLDCKVYWPLDAVWYCGHVVDYNSETGRHMVEYEDGEVEHIILSDEQVKFHVSLELMKNLKLKFLEKSLDSNGLDVNEIMALAASFDDSEEFETGDVIWAKLTGHAVWPAIVLDESHLGNHKGLSKTSGENSVLVQFFGTHDFARVKWKQVISFLKGLLSSYHSKCKKLTFVRGLEEAKMYLNEQRLPEIMLKLRKSVNVDVNNSGNGEHQNGSDSSDKDCMSGDETRNKIEDLQSCPLDVGDLQITSLGKIVKDSDNFHNDKFIWPEGYTAMRMFSSITDPSLDTLYKMEVLRDADSKSRPLFRVTAENGEEFNGPTPSACWNKIYKRIQVVQIRKRNYKADKQFLSGSSMFGFSHPKISKLIKEMSNSGPSFKSFQVASRKIKGFPVGYRSVNVEWRDLDKCNVCHMDEEYESNLFLQCDKCRMMVHARCYGESETTDDALWLCNLCCVGAPESPPPCCLCPVVGGAMKPTTDGRWAHLACAIWIPETCLSDIKKMEPIDGISRINKDRWKLLCSICNVSHGACIQCSNYNCRVAYHPLCARAAGFCLETENKDRHLVPSDDDEENQCIQLLSFCRRHRPLSSERLPLGERCGQEACEQSDYVPTTNPSGCARTEPYTSEKRRKSESEVPAASLKRLYVENMPYLLCGSSPHMPLWDKSSRECNLSVDLQKLRTSQLEASAKILSVADKYNFMRNTFRKRLAFGKSRIHGFGVFTKLQHRAGDMVIEYTGELIRPIVADRREHLIYNSLVGAGTYMFRIDDERVIDATRAGSIAQLINHSCEPNCYSRVIGVNGDDRIIIFAKRDLKQWEELTYDYRFVSSDQKLVCHCGSSRCRGVVNDIESEERAAKLHVSASELIDWQGE